MSGPFTFGPCSVYDDEEVDGSAVFAEDGQPFALIADDLCVGCRDGPTGSIARAKRLADLLNSHGAKGKLS